MNLNMLFKYTAVASAWAVMTSFADNATRGIGIYPGAPSESFAPTMASDTTYRNIARNRAATHSSAYDYNLTAQLVTDGITEHAGTVYLEALANGVPLPKREREWAIDGGEYTRNILMGGDVSLEYRWHGMTVAANMLRLVFAVAYDETLVGDGYSFAVGTKNGDDANEQWTIAGTIDGDGLPGNASLGKVHADPNKQTDEPTLSSRDVIVDIPIDCGSTSFAAMKIDLYMEGAVYWTVTEIKFFSGGAAVTDVLPSSVFCSAWMSNGDGEQWVCVDLGSVSTFNKVRLHWIERAVAGRIETSSDALSWTSVAHLQEGSEAVEDITFAETQGRYVRVLMTQPGAGGRYVLSEMEVMGRGGTTVREHERPEADGATYTLNGGRWLLQRASEVTGTGHEVSSPNFDDSSWLVATVPATVLMSYVNAGALPDPNYADNLMYISESFFNADFWYRTTFSLPSDMSDRHVFINLDGINWKAEVFVNGQYVDRVDGAFLRGRFEIGRYLTGDTNVLAIHIIKNEHPGAVKEKYNIDTDFNGGILGADNPTFHATIGWDWISTIRGRDIGVWNDVYLTAEGSVTLRDPLVTTSLALPDTLATMSPAVVLCNNEATSVSGTLRGWIGDITFEKQVTLPIHAETEINFSPDDFPQLRDRRMNLWWPNGYGAPFLYDAGFVFAADNSTSDTLTYTTGIRQIDYDDMDTQLTINVNGRRFVPLGGNWGFSENNLCYRGREYDIAVKYHRDMNFNCIRNWVGQTGDREFYEACDRHGIMVWQDFWLANPADGPDPADETMFLANARDYVQRIRQHACIGIYCGRNEGFPPTTIDEALRQYVAALHPTLGYISSSADGGVSGHGPYRALPANEYFGLQTGKLHSERGMPNVMTYEGLKRTLRPETLWPQGDAWGQHDYCQRGAQRGATFNDIISKAFGELKDAQAFTTLAQWENYEGYRAMFEASNVDRQGLLIWMSHACWPSMTWQCYDYYFEPTAAFFGCKKACEPLHVQWNSLTRCVEVVNRCGGDRQLLTVRRDILSAVGEVVDTASAIIYSPDDTTVEIPALCVADGYDLGGGNVFFVKLSMSDDDKLVSENFYVASNEQGNLRELNDLPQANVKAATVIDSTGMTVSIENVSETPAMMIRLNLTGDDGEQILPVDYSDNYFHLMPGERRDITIKWKEEDARGCAPMVILSGFNVEEAVLR